MLRRLLLEIPLESFGSIVAVSAVVFKQVFEVAAGGAATRDVCASWYVER